jgi:hypothetical protein
MDRNGNIKKPKLLRENTGDYRKETDYLSPYNLIDYANNYRPDLIITANIELKIYQIMRETKPYKLSRFRQNYKMTQFNDIYDNQPYKFD